MTQQEYHQNINDLLDAHEQSFRKPGWLHLLFQVAVIAFLAIILLLSIHLFTKSTTPALLAPEPVEHHQNTSDL